MLHLNTCFGLTLSNPLPPSSGNVSSSDSESVLKAPLVKIHFGLRVMLLLYLIAYWRRRQRRVFRLNFGFRFGFRSRFRFGYGDTGACRVHWLARKAHLNSFIIIHDHIQDVQNYRTNTFGLNSKLFKKCYIFQKRRV